MQIVQGKFPFLGLTLRSDRLRDWTWVTEAIWVDCSDYKEINRVWKQSNNRVSLLLHTVRNRLPGAAHWLAMGQIKRKEKLVRNNTIIIIIKYQLQGSGLRDWDKMNETDCDVIIKKIWCQLDLHYEDVCHLKRNSDNQAGTFFLTPLSLINIDLITTLTLCAWLTETSTKKVRSELYIKCCHGSRPSLRGETV